MLPEYLPLAEICRLRNKPYTTAKVRVDSGEIELHLINNKVVVKAEQFDAVMSTVRRRSKSLPAIATEDLFAA